MLPPAELQVLQLLAKEWRYNGPPGILEISQIVAALDLAPSEVLQALEALFRGSLVDMNTLKTSAYLTPEGFAFIEDGDRTSRDEINP
jgi:hypothetical protein